MNSKDFLRSLCTEIGPSGYEMDVARVWRDYVARFAETSVDINGNVIAVLNKSADVRVMLSGHIDEIGFMIRYIDKDGFLFFSPIGGIDANLVPGQRVSIKTQKGRVKGVIGKKPIHLMEREELSKCAKIESLFIDIGAKDKEEAEAKVSIGDVAVPYVEFWELDNGRIVSKALDDRAGAFVVARALELLAGRDIKVGVFAVASVQEEIGLRGARTSAYAIDPAIGIAVDVTFCTDHPGVDEKKIGSISLGKGPVIARGPNINPVLFERLKKTAEDSSIPYQIEGIPRATGTDANSIQISRSGVCTGLVSIPLRYMHTPVEMVEFNDIENSARLLADLIAGLDGDEDWRTLA